MKPEIKKLWTDALRSGEYTQTCDSLKDDQGYCCLGVLTDLYMKATGRGEWIEDTENPGHLGFKESWFNEFGVLATPVIDWAGLPGSNPSIEHETHTCLSEANDYGLDFSEIADIIDAQL